MNTIKKVIDTIFSLQEKVTLLGIGPMSPLIIESSVELASELDFPLFFIASRNQIESSALGGGYVNHWDQFSYSSYIDTMVKNKGFDGYVVKCRDHGGPWQRDPDFKEKLSMHDAVERACQSYEDDLKAGFRFLHVDTSKDPDYKKVVPAEIAVERVIFLVKKIEKICQRLGISDVVYEASLEETNGDFSEVEEFRHFVSVLRREFDRESLPLPTFMVGNTGTLTKMDKNIGKFDREIVQQLADIAQENGMILKAHNCDYLGSDILSIHPQMDVGMANVAPEFGRDETQGLLILSELEDRYIATKSFNDIFPSNIRDVIWGKIKQTGKWKKWVSADMEGIDEAVLFEDSDFVNRLIGINGHYFFSDSDVIEAREILYKNIEIVTGGGFDAVTQIKLGIKKSIARYVENFNMVGLTSEIRKQLGGSQVDTNSADVLEEI